MMATMINSSTTTTHQDTAKRDTAKRDVAKRDNGLESKSVRAEAALADVLRQALRRGFFGSAGVVLSVQDGHIQHIRLTVDRMIR